MSKKPKGNNTAVVVLLTVLIFVMIALTGLVIWMCVNLVNKTPQTTVRTETQIYTLPTVIRTEPTQAETQPPETTLPEPEHVVATASIGTMGDLLMHKPVFDTCLQSNGTYDFSSIFRYVKDIVSGLDYAIANLETTFGGDDYPYQGNPAFNCPDALIDSVVDTGYDMLLTANNHAGGPSRAGSAPITMDGRAVFRFAVDALPKCLHAVLDETQLTLDEVDWVVCHQANSRIIDHCVKALQADPAKFYKNMDRHGNTSAASIPVALNELAESGQLQPGQLLACIGFGGGLTWGGAIFQYKE